MLIAQISDTHILAAGTDHPSADLRARCLASCVEDINRQRPDAVVFTGDTTQHGRPGEYARLRELLAPLAAPLYLVPGNRDDNEELRRAFGDKAYLPATGGFLHYSVEDHAVRLIGLDSTAVGERKGTFCPERQAWLESVLEEEPDKPTVLCIHHPPFDVDDHYVGGYRRPEEAAALADIVGRRSQVSAVLCGHVHWLVECEWAGVAARVMPSVAIDLRKGIDEAEAGTRPIYLLHSLTEREGLVSRPRMADTVA